jgi:hypothetical protein
MNQAILTSQKSRGINLPLATDLAKLTCHVVEVLHNILPIHRIFLGVSNSSLGNEICCLQQCCAMDDPAPSDRFDPPREEAMGIQRIARLHYVIELELMTRYDFVLIDLLRKE